MSTIRIHREFAAFLALTSLACAQGCYVYQRPVGDAIAPGASVRVQSPAPFVVQAGGPSGEPTAAECPATMVEGIVAATAADTLRFSRLTGGQLTREAGPACLAIKGTAAIVRPAEARVTVRRYSGGRTLLLVALVSVGAFALMLSQADFGALSGGLDWGYD
jgi:hypothetical protein